MTNLIPCRTLSGVSRRGLLAVVLPLTVAAGTVAVTAAPVAASSVRYETNASWAYTDSHRPRKITIDQAGDLPIGSWTDDRGRSHTARAYFTFDIGSYQGADIESVTFSAKETSVVDCAKRPAIELWRTARYTAKSSWLKPPADLAKLFTSTLPDFAGCPTPYREWDATEGLRQALAEGATTLTLSLRLPVDLEADPSLGRRYASTVALSIDYNYPPGVPTDLQTNGEACTVAEPYQFVSRSDLGLTALMHDRDRNDTGGTDQLTATFALWPVDQPEARVERTDSAARNGERALGFYSPYLGDVEHGRVYAWQVRAADSRVTSEWSPVCYFRADFEGPAVAPAVTSTDFPAEGRPPALPGEVTFDAQGDQEVVGFVYSFNGSAQRTVTPGQPGGSATVTITPREGFNRIEVWSVDAAGNRSPSSTYLFAASGVSPLVDGVLTEIGMPATFTVRPRMTGVVRYRFGLDGDPEQSVAAQADGTASFSVTATCGGQRTLTVTSETADGVTATALRTFRLSTEPRISATVYDKNSVSGGQGIPGVFTFTPRVPDTVSYRYVFGPGEPVTVVAAADGTASVTWAPTEAGWTSLVVRSISRDGTESDAARYSFRVRDLLPQVSGNPYGPHYAAGGPGEPGEFRFSSEVPNTVEYRYRFGDGPEQRVGTDENGSAVIAWTPDQGGPVTLTVRGVTADGTVSGERSYTFLVNDAPLVESADYLREGYGGLPGLTGSFTFKPQRPGIVGYRYQFSYGEEYPVEAAADGTGTLVWTPQEPGWYLLRVRGVIADGTLTEPREYAFGVRNPQPEVISYLYTTYDPMGGIGVPGDFRFTSQLPDTVAFVYRLNDGPEQTVAVTDGTAADLAVTPDRGFRNTLTVRSRSASGELSPATTYEFVVSTAPAISSDTYPHGEPSGGAGVPGVFTFTPRMPDVAKYVYQFDNGRQVTVPADADGSASVTLTPTEARWYPISVYSLDKDGNESHRASYWFVVQG